MSGQEEASDLVIVGGGLAGLMAAARAEALGGRATLVNAAVPGTPAELGGFAQFSGAKFSLAPAGSGLVPIAGGEDELLARYREACAYYLGFGFEQFRVGEQQLRGEEGPVERGLSHRQYHSILLSPTEIARLLAAIAAELRSTRIIWSRVDRLELDGAAFAVSLQDGRTVRGRALIVAAGRLGSDLLSAANVPEGMGKGIDVGVRLEFEGQAPVAGLRELGPDAKFTAGRARTFCLNSPGRIFHYPGLGLQIPGGVVAEQGEHRSNVGILVRISDRRAELGRLRAATRPEFASPLMQRGCGDDLRWTPASRDLLGCQTIDVIEEFLAKLTASGLVRLPHSYTVHYPLLDWHWPVFSMPNRLGTAIDGVIAAGDASGHARGLMQAAVMGTMAAEEALL